MLKRQGHTKSIDWYLLGVLLYEMIVGVPPYFSTDRTKLFENIQGGPLKIPHTMSEQARGLILQLLNRNPLKRLGAGPKDSEDIKSNIFFKDVDWRQVIERRLPVPKPRIRKIEQNPAISIQSFLLEEEKNLTSDIVGGKPAAKNNTPVDNGASDDQNKI
jgi:serine/threonine protein kinase